MFYPTVFFTLLAINPTLEVFLFSLTRANKLVGLSCNILLLFFLTLLAVVGLESRNKHSADDGFVTVSLKPDRGTDFLFFVLALLLVQQLLRDL